MVKTVTEVYSFYKYLVSIVIYSFYCKCNFTAVAIQQGNIKRFCQLIKTHLLIQTYEWHNDCSCFQYIKGSPEGCRSVHKEMYTFYGLTFLSWHRDSVTVVSSSKKLRSLPWPNVSPSSKTKLKRRCNQDADRLKI